MSRHISFPKIIQLAEAVRTVRDRQDFQGIDMLGFPIIEHLAPYPVVKYSGTTKIHGTNAGIYFSNGVLEHIQSRNRVISVMQDNAGFARFVEGINATTIAILAKESRGRDIVFFGEWCGKGIQKGVAVNLLPLMFVLFGMALVDTEGKAQLVELPNLDLQELNAAGIYEVSQFGTWEIEIDFEDPEQLTAWVAEVEQLCPVGTYFKESGGGEGIVWRSCSGSAFPTFKTKGEKHSATRTKVKIPVDTEHVESVTAYVDCTVTSTRLQQGISTLKELMVPITPKSTGIFLKWVAQDITAEDGAMLSESGLCWKDVAKSVTKKALEFWQHEVESSLRN